jgi:hypothetical protein
MATSTEVVTKKPNFMWQHDFKGLLLRKLCMIQLLIACMTESLAWVYSVLSGLGFSVVIWFGLVGFLRQDLTLKLTSNSQSSSFCLLCAGITDVHHKTCLVCFSDQKYVNFCSCIHLKFLIEHVLW